MAWLPARGSWYSRGGCRRPSPGPAVAAGPLETLRGGMLHVAMLLLTSPGCDVGPAPAPGEPPAPAASREARLAERCGACHPVPPPDALPRDAWGPYLRKMYAQAGLGDGLDVDLPVEWATEYYASRAPAGFDLRQGAPAEAPGALVARHTAPEGAPATPAIANVRLADIGGDARLELLATDMRHGRIFVSRPYAAEGRFHTLARMKNPSHVEPCDLDGDGVLDLVATDLGTFFPNSEEKGAVIYLRRDASGKTQSIPLLTELGRPADVRPADLDGDGDLDLVVAGFGLYTTGSLLWLENRGEGPLTAERFVRHQLDPRSGWVNVVPVDLDRDGVLDLVGVVAQQHEQVVWFRGTGGGAFAPTVIYAAPHPGWGSNGVEVVDLDADGDLDMLVTNGDTLDNHVLKPYHGVAWLEQTAPGTYVRRPIGALQGVHRATPGDLDGDGDLDVVAVSFLPQVMGFSAEERAALRLESVVWWEQTAPRTFVRHVLESDQPFHTTVDVADVDGDGKAEIATGWFTISTEPDDQLPHWLSVWRAPSP